MIFNLSEIIKKKKEALLNDAYLLRNKNYILALIKTNKDNDIIINKLIAYSELFGFKIKIELFTERSELELNDFIQDLNYNLNINSILIDNNINNAINEIIPFKSIYSTNPIINTIKDILSSVNLSNKKILFNGSSQNNYLKELIDYFCINNAILTITGNDSTGLSSLLTYKNIILIANNKLNSIGYEVIENINEVIEEKIIHGIDTDNAIIIDMNMHNNKNGNIQYNNPEQINKYNNLQYIDLIAINDYIDLLCLNYIENFIECIKQQEKIKNTYDDLI